MILLHVDSVIRVKEFLQMVALRHRHLKKKRGSLVIQRVLRKVLAKGRVHELREQRRDEQYTKQLQVYLR